MTTYFLSQHEVRAYLRDFLVRVNRIMPAPNLLCPLTRSGMALLREMLALIPELAPALSGPVPITAAAVTDGLPNVRFVPDEPGLLKGRHVLLFDGAVHSGRMMARCVSELRQRGAAGICTYSLVLKRSTSFVPTLWGLAMDDTDRAFFLLDDIPNHRLDSGRMGARLGYVHLRLLGGTDLALPPVVSGVGSLDRVTWGDRHFDVQAGAVRRTYLLEAGGDVVGYLTVSGLLAGCLHIDEVAVDHRCHGKGYGAILLRFADTLARQFNCRRVRLYGIEDRVSFYESFGYVRVGNPAPVRLDAETYHLMERPVLYHLHGGTDC